jgi:hypothetical protein
MSNIKQILDQAERALAKVVSDDKRSRLDAMTDFMRSFERLALEVAKGETSWDDVRPWAQRNSERLVAAKDALADWEHEMYRIFLSGGEEEAEWALDRRSQHALARELFRGTPADELLATHEDEEMDREFRDEAERLALDGPSYVPRTHTWWRWRDD